MRQAWAKNGFERNALSGTLGHKHVGRSSMKDFCLLAGAGLAAPLALTLAGTALAADATPDLSGIYWASEYHAKIQLVGGGELPLTPEGKAAYEKNMAGL